MLRKGRSNAVDEEVLTSLSRNLTMPFQNKKMLIWIGCFLPINGIFEVMLFYLWKVVLLKNNFHVGKIFNNAEVAKMEG